MYEIHKLQFLAENKFKFTKKVKIYNTKFSIEEHSLSYINSIKKLINKLI